MNKFLRGISLYLLIAIIAVSIFSGMFPQTPQRREYSYSQLMELIERGQVSKATTIGLRIEGELKNGTLFYAIVPTEENLSMAAEAMRASGVDVQAKEATTPWWWHLLPNIITIVVFVGIWLFILNQMQGGSNRAMSFGKSRAKLHTEEKTKVRFTDVAGLEEAKQELVEIVQFLKHPKRFVELGAKIPKGVLLVGPPGTGKTLLARAVAGEAGVPFFSISGSDFVEMFVGVGAARVRDMFENAKKNAPCIVFVDELDAVGRHRGAGLGGGHDEREQTLNQLLVEMDGFEANSGIIIMAATNRPDVLDPALLRPGRFDRKIVVDLPDVEGRKEILQVHGRNKPLAEDVDLEVLAKQTPGFSGADLENLMNEGAILGAREGAKKITMRHLEEAIDRVLMGPEKKRRRITQKDKKTFAYHEAGHALTAHYLPHADEVHKITIVGRGLAGGYTKTLPAEERHLNTRSELFDRITWALGGRAAEELVLNEISTGAQNDLERATKLARKMVMEWGMSEKLGPLTFGRQHEEQIFLGRDISRERNYSEEVAAQIDREVRNLIDESYDRALTILREHQEELKRLVKVLMEKETLEREEFLAIVEGEDTSPESEAGPQPADEAAGTMDQPAAEKVANASDAAASEGGRENKPQVGKPAIEME